MSHTPTPPPPPPKPPSFQQAGTPQPGQSFQGQPLSPSHSQPPPLPPYPPQQSPASAYPPRTSSWNAPYQPDQGLHRQSFPDPSASHQQTYQDYPEQQQYPQSPTAHQDSPQPIQQHQQQHQPQPLALPESLTTKSKTDLAHLLSTPALQHALIHARESAHPTLHASQQHLAAQLSANISLATTLQTLEGTLDAARATTSAQLLRVRGLETAWKKKQGELERRLEPWGPRELHQRLGAAIAEQEGMCVALEGSFVEGAGVAGEREVGEWVRRVREGRRLVALRRERKRRWDEGRVGGWR